MVGRNMAAMLGFVALILAGAMNIPVRADPNACETGCGAGPISQSGTRYSEQCLGNVCYWRCCQTVPDEHECGGWGSPNCVDACNEHQPCQDLN